MKDAEEDATSRIYGYKAQNEPVRYWLEREKTDNRKSAKVEIKFFRASAFWKLAGKYFLVSMNDQGIWIEFLEVCVF